MEVFLYFLGIFFALVPLITGIAMKVRPPMKINSFYGFRTKTTKSSEAVWRYANDLFSFVIIVFSVVGLLIYSIIILSTHFVFVGFDWVITLIGLALAAVTFLSAGVLVNSMAKKFAKKHNISVNEK